MNLDILLDPQNPRMALIWSFASDQYLFKKRNPKQYREILSIDVADVCSKLKELITGHSKEVDSQAYFRSSMVASGALRLHNKQTDFLLEDTKKLLETMRREKKAVESLDEKLDCTASHARGVEPDVIDLLFDKVDGTVSHMRPAIAPVTTTLSATAASAARVQPVDWGSLDGDIDWTQGPPRACMHQITLPDADVPPSTAYVAELERLRVLEGSFEGPTLLDWEEEVSRESSPKLAEEKTDQSITEAPVDTLAPVETKEPSLSEIVIEEAPDILPPVVEGPELPTEPEPHAPEPQATPQTPEEQPSQIELAPLEDREEQQRQAKRAKRVRPVMDPIIYLSSDTIRMQIQSHLDTLRNRNASEDIINLKMLKLHRADFFCPKPVHQGVMADTLLKLFRPCEAAFFDPGSPLPEIARAASYVEETDLSAVPSLMQDTSTGSLQRSRSTLIEAPTGLFEEVPHPLQPIEEHKVPAPATPPPPPPPPQPSAGDMRPPAEEMATQKPEHMRRDRDADVARTTQPTRDSSASKQTSPEISGAEASKEEFLGLQGEELELSETHDQSIAEPEVVARMVLDYLATHQEAFFNDLLPQDPTDEEAGHLFDQLLQMYKDSKLRLLQDHVFGPIRVNMAAAADISQQG